ncbi:MAG: hypothetical protein IKQ58_05115 [Prevotella sp.]|nr:hypothetical protein [Prevotella sp.]MBR6828730.1 hypothetical protein [Prevotella sp.]
MDPAKRIIANTAAQYLKSITNICLSLYSTRLVLDALNVSDYGVYSLVAGVVGILSYLTNALVVTTQRYLSYNYGIGNLAEVRKVFANSLLIHIIISAVFCLLLLFIESLIMDRMLNIDPARLEAAKVVFRITVAMLVLTIITSPFKALLIARENIVYISIVEVADGVMRLMLAVGLLFVHADKLIVYAIGMGGILLVNFLAYVLYTHFRYEESRLELNSTIIDSTSIRQLTGFAGWTTYGMVAGVCQMQGLAVVLNHFFGTIINSAYGLATQVNGAVRFVSTSVLNAMNPQIMQAEGNGNRQLMIKLACKESKFSTALMMMLAIPIIVETPAILSFWLKEVPEHTTLFCRAMMLAFLIDQLTLGLHAANQATGIIRMYSLIMFTPKILIVPIAWGFLAAGLPVASVMWLYVGIELGVALCRIPFMWHSVGLNMAGYLRTVIVPLIPLCLIACAVSLCMVWLFDFHYRFILTLLVAIPCSLLTFWFFTLDHSEREYVTNLANIRLHS